MPTESVDFVIITALDEERAAILDLLPDCRRHSPSGDDIRIYYSAQLPVTLPDGEAGHYQVIILQLLNMGRVQAATAVSDAIRRWQPRFVLMVGIAGGVAAKKVRIGDVLVSEQVVDYELQKLTANGPQIRWQVYRADPRLLGASQHLVDGDWVPFVQSARPNADEPRRVIGPVASGDKVIAFGAELERYREHWVSLIGVEMEAAGVATAAFQAAEPPGFFMVRGVSDLADETKDSAEVDRWRPYACQVAATYTLALLKSGPVPLRSNPKQAQLILEGDYEGFDSTRRDEVAKVLATLLRIPPESVRVLTMSPGSIQLLIELPEFSLYRLMELWEERHPDLIALGVISVLSTVDNGRSTIETFNVSQLHDGRGVAPETVARPIPQSDSLPADSILGFAVGDIVAGLEPDEHAEIRRMVPFGNKVLIEAVGVTSRREIRRPLGQDELARLIRIRGGEFTFDGDAEAFLLGVEAQRISIAYQFDPLFAVNSSVVDILPHQVEAVYRYLLPLPRIRFLLADDTGAGKTIMTGLLIKELLFRGALSKVLIITPGGLTRQWQEEEMRDKFGLQFRLINRASFEAEPGQFARQDDGFFITSIDFIARNEGCLNAAKEAQWDLIVVDEAHKLSAYEYGTKVERSERYRAVEALAPRTDHLLFLTATPHRGRKDSFRRLLMLLDEDLFQKDELVTQRIHEAVATYSAGVEAFEGETAISKARNRFFLRRLKEEMVGWDRQQLFKPRHTRTIGYDLTPEELDLYNAVTRYVRSQRRQAKARKNRNVELTLMVMQRRLASSIFAITRTLQKRLEALEEVLRILREPGRTPADKKRMIRSSSEDVPSDIGEYEELDETEREAIDKRIFRQVLSDDPEEVEKERQAVVTLLSMALALKDHPEAKFGELLRVLDESDVIRRDDEKLVIFTEHKDTLDNLTDRLTRRGYTVSTIHGGMDVDARKQAQRDFRNRAKIMIATEAAGEGINLQFCRYLINWDIPWNPNRLEQRMGRIHRYGQQGDVWVYNLVATNTREGSVLEKVLKKLDVMRDQMGQDRVYDVIDELLEDVPLVQLIERSIDDDNSDAARAETESHLADGLEEKAQALVALQKKQSLASHLDLREAQRLRDTSDERRLQPLFIQNFFLRSYQAAAGTITEDRHFPVFHIGRTPTEILAAARRARLPVAEKYDTPFVFDKDLVSVASKVRVPEHTRLLGPGHPLFSATIEWAVGRARDAFAKGVVLVDPSLDRPQRVWLVNSTVEDGRREEKKRLAHQQLSVVIADHEGLRAVSPAHMLNYTAPESSVERPEVPGQSLDEIQAWSYENVTEPQLQTVQQHRQNECDLRRRYLETTFTDLILGLQEQLNDLQQGQLVGDDDPDERQKLERRILQLKERRATRLAELELMLRLTANLPNIHTSALVIPAPVAVLESEVYRPSHGMPMRRDDEVERIAMDVVMRFERARGWTPQDVSKDGEHYDIRSESRAGDIRYIEVKGRAESGAIIVTGPEVDKLRQLGERAFLYIVTHCKREQPRLRIIQDPMAQLTPEMLYRQVQYLVDERDWQQKGEAVNDVPALD